MRGGIFHLSLNGEKKYSDYKIISRYRALVQEERLRVRKIKGYEFRIIPLLLSKRNFECRLMDELKNIKNTLEQSEGNIILKAGAGTGKTL